MAASPEDAVILTYSTFFHLERLGFTEGTKSFLALIIPHYHTQLFMRLRPIDLLWRRLSWSFRPSQVLHQGLHVKETDHCASSYCWCLHTHSSTFPPHLYTLCLHFGRHKDKKNMQSKKTVLTSCTTTWKMKLRTPTSDWVCRVIKSVYTEN